MTFYNNQDDNGMASIQYSFDEQQKNDQYDDIMTQQANNQENHSLVLLYNQILNDFELNLNIKFDDNLKYLLYNNLTNYYNTHLINVLEEKEVIIQQLKQSLVDLTDKRFRSLNQASSQNGHQSIPPILNQHNIEFLLNEKEKQLQDLRNDLNEKDNDIKNLKKTIKEQDDVILQLNNNIFELKNNNETVLRAKQDSFRLMNEESLRRQKLIDDQTVVIKNLKEKIEYLEEDYSKSRQDLEKRLNEKDNELRIKIASFEANLYQGKQYFEEVLNEKNQALREKIDELNSLKKKLNMDFSTSDEKKNENESDGEKVDEDEDLEDKSVGSSASTSNDVTNSASFIKFESDTIKNIKSLYEHQIDNLKLKIEMLEKTCLNYQQGIKEMNSSFGYKIQNDEMASIQVFKEIMQDTQKKNAQLETDLIELQVKLNKFKKECEDLQIEKDNLNKKAFNLDNQMNRLANEKLEFETYHKKQIDLKTNEINLLLSELNMVKEENVTLLNENIYLNQISKEHDELKVQHSQLTAHYEQLYAHASDIVNGNQMLNDENQSNKLVIEDLQNKLNDLNIKLDQLEWSNSDLNTKKINLDLKCGELEEKMSEFDSNLDELLYLRKVKSNLDDLKQQYEELSYELIEKNDLIDQLNKAKEFLAENNSKLLTNNIKIQLFLESMGIEDHQSLIENNPHVKEFDDIKEQLHNVSIELNELKFKFKQAELNIIEKDNELIKLNILLNKLNNITKLSVFPQTDIDEKEDEVEKKDYEEKSQQTETEQDKNTNSKNSTEYEEILAKCNKLEEQNVKYKAKLKQLLKSSSTPSSNQQIVQTESNETQTDMVQSDIENFLSKCSKLEAQLENLKQNSSNNLNCAEKEHEDLVNYGALLGCEKLKENTLNELSELNEYVNQTLKEFKTLKFDYDLLLNDKNLLEQRLNSIIHNLNMDLEEKIKLIDEMKKNDSSLNDLSQIFNLKNENTNLSNELNQVKSKIFELESNKFLDQKQVEDLKNEIFSLNEQVKHKTEQISKLEMENTIIQNENQYNLEQINELKSNLNNNEEINSLKNENLSLQNELELSRSKLNDFEINERLNKEEIIALKSEISNLNEQIKEKFDQIEKLEMDISLLQNENQYNIEQQNNNDNLDNLKNEKSLLENKLSELNSKLSLFENNEMLNDKKIEDLNAEILNLNDQIQTKLDQISQLEMDNLLLQNENESLKSKFNENSTSNDNFELILNEKKLIQSQLQNMKSLFNQENDDLRTEITNLNDLMESKLKRIDELENLNSILENDKLKLEQDFTKQANPSAAGTQQEYEDLKLKLSQLENQNLKYKAKLKQLLQKEKETTTSEKIENEALQQHQSPSERIVSNNNNNEILLNTLKNENSNLLNQLEDFKSVLNQLELDKTRLENELIQLKQEKEIFENDNILALNEKENELKLIKEENESFSSKLSNLEQMNLKYKAKLKQVLKQQQQQNTTGLNVSLLEEQRSTNSTPTPFISPNVHHIQTSSTETQTDSISNELTQEKSEEDEFEKLKQQNIKLKAKVKQLMHSNEELSIKQSTTTFDQSVVDNYLTQINELTTQIETLKSNESSLNQEINSIKESFQSEIEHLNQIIDSKSNEILSKLNEKENKIRDLSLELEKFNFDRQKEVFDSINNTSACSSLLEQQQKQPSNTSLLSETAKYNHLEAQLKYCSEKCEKVVAKLNQLKTHNQSLNNKIRSIKSMVNV